MSGFADAGPALSALRRASGFREASESAARLSRHFSEPAAGGPAGRRNRRRHPSALFIGIIRRQNPPLLWKPPETDSDTAPSSKAPKTAVSRRAAESAEGLPPPHPKAQAFPAALRSEGARAQSTLPQPSHREPRFRSDRRNNSPFPCVLCESLIRKPLFPRQPVRRIKNTMQPVTQARESAQKPRTTRPRPRCLLRTAAAYAAEVRNRLAQSAVPCAAAAAGTAGKPCTPETSVRAGIPRMRADNPSYKPAP